MPGASWPPASGRASGWRSGRPTAPSGCSPRSARCAPVPCWYRSTRGSRAARRRTSCGMPGPPRSSRCGDSSAPTTPPCWPGRTPVRSPASSCCATRVTPTPAARTGSCSSAWMSSSPRATGSIPRPPRPGGGGAARATCPTSSSPRARRATPRARRRPTPSRCARSEPGRPSWACGPATATSW